MRILGIILIVIGVIGFFIGSFSVTRQETVAELGPFEIEREETKTFPVTPVASGIAVAAGLALVVVGSRRQDA